MGSTLRAFTMFAAMFSLVVAACDDDEGDSGGDDMGTGPADDGSGDAPADDGGDAPADDGADAPADDGADAPADDGADDGGSGKALGEDCASADECAEGYCLMFEDAGVTYGFCTRSCTSAEDCPESGWECNLAPHTACVPAG
jgi:hypothetical protein